MPEAPIIEAAVRQYLKGMDSADVELIAPLYAEDATCEDPVGQPPKIGKAAIHAFYTGALEYGCDIDFPGPIHITESAAAFAFNAKIKREGGIVLDIDVIDVFDFNDDGKITRMRAYTGQTNVRVISES